MSESVDSAMADEIIELLGLSPDMERLGRVKENIMRMTEGTGMTIIHELKKSSDGPGESSDVAP